MSTSIYAYSIASSIHLVFSATLAAQAVTPAVLHPAIQATWATVIYPAGNGAGGVAHSSRHVPSHAN